MIADLKKRLDERGEDYVLLLYGDHIPSLTFEDDQFNSGEQTQTEYVIVTNMDLDLEDRDLYAYEMSDYLLRAVGVSPGVFQNIHKRYYNFEDPENNTTYDDKLLLMQYDMLYGEKYIYNYIPEYKGEEMKLGLYDITIDSASFNPTNGSFTVKGTNFTEFSTVLIDDKRYDTLCIDENTLVVTKEELGEEPEKGAAICVAQIDKDKHELSRSHSLCY